MWDGDVLIQEIHPDSTITYLYEPGSFVPLARVQSQEGMASYGPSADENSATDAIHLPQQAQWGLPQDRHAADAHLASYADHQASLKEQAHQAAWQQKLDKAQQNAQTDTLLHYQCDHLGTPLELIDETGKVVWAARYKAWGRVLRYDKRDVEQPLRFQGQYEDNETGLFYNRYRYYDPDQARYITQDPIGLAGGNNLYQYAPNATAWIDPLGLSKKCDANQPCPCPPGSMDPNKINFSQRSVTGDGPKGANSYAETMMAGGWDWAGGPKLRVMNVGGSYVSYDNRRLAAARIAKKDCVPIDVVNPSAPGPLAGKNWQDAFDQRMNDPRNIRLGGPVPPGGLSGIPIFK